MTLSKTDFINQDRETDDLIHDNSCENRLEAIEREIEFASPRKRRELMREAKRYNYDRF